MGEDSKLQRSETTLMASTVLEPQAQQAEDSMLQRSETTMTANTVLEQQTQQAESRLLGGWSIGDEAVSTIQHGKIQVGDCGTVMGASSYAEAFDADKRVRVRFGEKGTFHFLSDVHLSKEKVRLASGWSIGDEVVSRIQHGKIQVGDSGTVVGASSYAEAFDADKRVRVRFGEKGTFHFLSDVQLSKEKVRLPSGWSIGDEVVSTIQHGKIQVGDSGTVIGSSNYAEAFDADKRVRVRFGEKGTFHFISDVHLSKEKAEQSMLPQPDSITASTVVEQQAPRLEGKIESSKARSEETKEKDNAQLVRSFCSLLLPICVITTSAVHLLM